MHTYIHISATPLPYYVWNPWNRRIFAHGATLLGNFHILSNMPSLLILIDAIKKMTSLVSSKKTRISIRLFVRVSKRNI